MSKKNENRFADLTWNEIIDWAGKKIASRGRNYQRNGHVSHLAETDDGALIAWVDGTRRYATKVIINAESGLPGSKCSCPYEFNCKHGVATVLEYQKQLEKQSNIPEVRQNDERLRILRTDEYYDELFAGEKTRSNADLQDLTAYLKSKKMKQLSELLLEFADLYPDVKRELIDRMQLESGSAVEMVKRLSRDISNLDTSHYYDPYEDEIPDVDIDDVTRRLAELFNTGHSDEVLALGEELIAVSNNLVMNSLDDGAYVTASYPVIAAALEQSSMELVDKLEWVTDIELKDEYNLCHEITEYLNKEHGKTNWSKLADRLLRRLDTFEIPDGKTDYERKYFTDMIMLTLGKAERGSEVIALAKTEAGLNSSHARLVELLIDRKEYNEAETWIRKGLDHIADKGIGGAHILREHLKKIRSYQNDWPKVAAYSVNEFILSPSERNYSACRDSAVKADIWPKTRNYLLAYLESGTLPWDNSDWPLPDTVLPRPAGDGKKKFPVVDVLIDVAIFDDEPDRVLYWYDRRTENRSGYYYGDDSRIAEALLSYAPERAASIWQRMAEAQIDKVKASAYEIAARYLLKAEQILTRENKLDDWNQYFEALKRTHKRKTRLLEELSIRIK